MNFLLWFTFIVFVGFLFFSFFMGGGGSGRAMVLGKLPVPGRAPVAQWVKRWPTDLADRVRSPLVAKSSQP